LNNLWLLTLINDQTRREITVAFRIVRTRSIHGKEPEVMALPDNDPDQHGGFVAQTIRFLDRLFKALSAAEKRQRNGPQTSELRDFQLLDGQEFTFGYPIS